MAKEKGHTVRRLPPYHCELNEVGYTSIQEESFKMRNNQPVLAHTDIMERGCACLKVSPSTVRQTLAEFEFPIHDL
jgi:hypothetical protein